MASNRERRLFRREQVVQFKQKGTLAVIGEDETLGDVVMVRDFAKGGLGVFSNVEADTGSLLRFSLMDKDYGVFEGRIAWCIPSSGDPMAPPEYPYRLGIEFTPADDQARERQLDLYKYFSSLVGQIQVRQGIEGKTK